MQIVKSYYVQRLEVQRAGNRPYRLILLEPDSRSRVESQVTFDDRARERHGIPLAFEVAGATLECRFEAVVPVVRATPGLETLEKFLSDPDILCMQGVYSHTETRAAYSGDGLDSWTRREIKLETYTGFDGIHPTPLPCPYYELTVPLSDDEYLACMRLAKRTVFRATFKIL